MLLDLFTNVIQVPNTLSYNNVTVDKGLTGYLSCIYVYFRVTHWHTHIVPFKKDFKYTFTFPGFYSYLRTSRELLITPNYRWSIVLNIPLILSQYYHSPICFYFLCPIVSLSEGIFTCAKFCFHWEDSLPFSWKL